MSRRCGKCPTSSMAGHVRHLHELALGDRFRFEDSGEKGIVFQLLSVSDARCEIGRPPEQVTTTITRQRKGKTVLSEPETVSFTKTVTGRTSCTGSAQVIPVLTLEEQLGRSIAEKTYLDHPLTCECDACQEAMRATGDWIEENFPHKPEPTEGVIYVKLLLPEGDA